MIPISILLVCTEYLDDNKILAKTPAGASSAGHGTDHIKNQNRQTVPEASVLPSGVLIGGWGGLEKKVISD